MRYRGYIFLFSNHYEAMLAMRKIAGLLSFFFLLSFSWLISPSFGKKVPNSIWNPFYDPKERHIFDIPVSDIVPAGKTVVLSHIDSKYLSKLTTNDVLKTEIRHKVAFTRCRVLDNTDVILMYDASLRHTADFSSLRVYGLRFVNKLQIVQY
jgi:hypothetical protein